MISPPEYVSLSNFMELMFLDEEKTSKIGLHEHCIKETGINHYTVQDLLMQALLLFLRDNMFLSDSSGKIVRISSELFQSECTIQSFFGSRSIGRAEFVNEASKRFPDFRVGRVLPDDVIKALFVDDKVMELFNAGVEYSIKGDKIITNFDHPSQALAAKLNEFVWQHDFLRYPMFVNLYHGSIDFSLYNWVCSKEKTVLGVPNMESAHRWAAILKPFQGHYLCVPERFQTTDSNRLAFWKLLENKEIRFPNFQNPKKRKRGAKPSGAKEAYYRLYPDGKPDGVPYEAIAAELAETGINRHPRSLSNYEIERNGS